MPEPLVCEDSSLERLMETVHETPGARILYQDTVRRGGVLGFFAREIHRVAYIGAGETVELPGLTLPPVTEGFDSSLLPDYDDDLMMLADLVNESRPAAPIAPAAPTVAAAPATPVAPTIPVSFPTYEPATNSVVDTDDSAATAFAALLAEADAEEVDAHVGRHHAAGGTDFAAILSRYTADLDEPESPSTTNPISIVPDLAADVFAEVTPIMGRGAQARDRLELLMQLRQAGVPVNVNPGSDVQGMYQALEEILDQLPEPAALPNRPGQLLAIVGERGPALRAARTTAKLLRLPADEIVVAGLDEDEAGGLRRINGRRQAARLRQEILESDLPAIVVVVTDAVGADDATDTWAADLLQALRADLTWAVIDARWKAEDCHGVLDRLGPVQALVVHAAELSASPASVWELDLPLALLDERRPSTFVWLSLLSRLFSPIARTHRATA